MKTKCLALFILLVLVSGRWAGWTETLTLSSEQQEAFQTFVKSLQVLESAPRLLENDALVKRLQTSESKEKLEALDRYIHGLQEEISALQKRSEAANRNVEKFSLALDLLHAADGSQEALPPDHPVPAQSTEKTKEVEVKEIPVSTPPEKPSSPSTGSPALELYINHVLPVMESKCLMCHEGNRAKSGFDLKNPRAIIDGGDRGVAVVPGDAEKSYLYQLVTHQREPYMPYKLPKLSDEEIGYIRDWINAGAPVPQDDAPVVETQKISKAMEITDEDRSFWSFQRLVDHTPPVIENEQWSKNPIDTFIYKKLVDKAITPTERASKQKLIRRLYFDLTGLPPTQEEVQAFINDESPGAYEKVVDHLLASKHFGERWGRHWLDVARYADSGGYEFDFDRPDAYPYRDFVIKALNEDMPYDRFIKYQLAGDEYDPDNPMALAATGFCTNGPTIGNQETELNRYNELDDILSTTSQAFLGLTIACARCHDHKYDPISQRDYYQMLSVFTTTERNKSYMAPKEEIETYRHALRENRQQIESVRRDIEEYLKPVTAPVRERKIASLPVSNEEKDLLRLPFDPKNQQQRELFRQYRRELNVSDEELERLINDTQADKVKQYNRIIEQLELDEPEEPPEALTLTDKQAEPDVSYFLKRGSPDMKDGEVQPAFLQVITPKDRSFSDWHKKPEQANTTMRRTAMAEWLVDTKEGAGHLTARVIVNRLWHHHFGKGIVRTPSDFGYQGEPPTHPELLDWLACRLIENGWHLKPLHKMIVMSETYRQDTTYDPKKSRVDPDNRLLWHRRPLRVESEIIRDSILKVSGCLNEEMFGPGIYPWMHPDAVATGSTKKWPDDVVDGPETWRRSVYIYIRRSVLMPMMQVFDMPDTTASCAKRMVTTIAPQALALMNNKFSREQSAYFAARVIRQAGSDLQKRVEQAYWLSLSRAPSDSEMKNCLAFLTEQAQRYAAGEKEAGPTIQQVAFEATLDSKSTMDLALVDLCQVMFNLNEFIYVD